jgi:hypothetical protein
MEPRRAKKRCRRPVTGRLHSRKYLPVPRPRHASESVHASMHENPSPRGNPEVRVMRLAADRDHVVERDYSMLSERNIS